MHNLLYTLYSKVQNKLYDYIIDILLLETPTENVEYIFFILVRYILAIQPSKTRA